MLLAMAPLSAHAEIYRIVKPDGSVEYTDKKPAQIDETVRQIDAPEVKNSTDTRAITRDYEQLLKAEERAKASAIAAEKRRQKQRKPLREQLRKAKAALAAGQVKQAGDYIRNANGGTRLSPAYFSRIAELEAAVREAEQALEQAQ